MIELSIIIINYNTYKITCDCIQSIIDTTQDVAYEIILIDNGSTECLAIDFKHKFPKINLSISEVNLGFAGGNNFGLQIAKGKYILLLNSDTILIENSIQLSLKKIKTLNNVGFLGIQAIYPNGKLQDTCSRLPTIKNLVSDLFFLHQIFPGVKNYYSLNKSFYPDAIWGCYMLFKKELLLNFKKNQLNDTFFMYCEDLLWCWEARELKLKNYYYADTRMIHLNKGSQKDKKVKDKMNTLLTENKVKLKNIINGKLGTVIYNLLVKMLYYRSKFTRYLLSIYKPKVYNDEYNKI